MIQPDTHADDGGLRALPHTEAPAEPPGEMKVSKRDGVSVALNSARDAKSNREGSKHTPGPWWVDELAAPWSDGHAIAHERNGHVAHTTRGFGKEQEIANARLIAAAPDLYDALSNAPCFGCGVRFGQPEGSGSRGCVTCRPARAAIAKAQPSEASPPSAELGATGLDRGRDEQISRLQHSLSLAVEALGPFAKAYRTALRDLPPEMRPIRLELSPHVTPDDFRRARDVHSKLTESE